MPWKVFARTPDLKRYGQVEFNTLEFVSRFNAVGAWIMELHGTSTLVAQLTQPQWGIEVVNDAGLTVFAGPIDKPTRERDQNTNKLTLSGSDDNTYLFERVAHPQPATPAPPYNTNGHDVRTGLCSTVLMAYADVNVGGSALGPRKAPGLTVDADPLAGSTITGRARWQNLLEFLQSLALEGGGLGFRVQQVGTALKFQVFTPQDRSATVQFSLDKGNLGGYSYSDAKSTTNYVVVGGDGEGTARTIQEGQDSDEIARWRRIEKFVDRRDTADSGELGQSITKELEEGRGETAVTAQPVDLPGCEFLVDYNLGDKVSAVIDDVVITDVVREVKVNLTPDGPQTVKASIGTPAFRDVLKIFRSLQRLNTRVTNLERR